LADLDDKSGNNYLSLFKCTCGKETIAVKGDVRAGKVNSCGCLRAELLGARSKGRTPPGAHSDKTLVSFHLLYNSYKSKSRKHGKVFQLTKEEFRSFTKQNCHYCGRPPIQKIISTRGREPYVYNGIDRKDNSIGYLLFNCLPCCKECNYTKGSRLTYEEMQLVITHRRNKSLKPAA
jgi:hypothetical protein